MVGEKIEKILLFYSMVFIMDEEQKKLSKTNHLSL